MCKIGKNSFEEIKISSCYRECQRASGDRLKQAACGQETAVSALMWRECMLFKHNRECMLLHNIVCIHVYVLQQKIY